MKGFQIKKIAASTIAATALFAATTPAQAALTATGTFNVTINLTSACTVDTTGLAPVFNYTSGQSGSASFATAQSFKVTCTQSTPYTLSLDASGTGYTGSFSSPTGTYTNTATNLQYSLTLPSATAGTGSAQTYALTGNIAGGQGGICNGTSCSVTDIHTLTVTY